MESMDSYLWYEKAGFLKDSAPMRGVRCPHIPSLDRLRESRVLRGVAPMRGVGCPHAPFFPYGWRTADSRTPGEEKEDSGVASGQVETAKYVEFRNITASSFAGHLTCFCDHGVTMFLRVRLNRKTIF